MLWRIVLVGFAALLLCSCLQPPIWSELVRGSGPEILLKFGFWALVLGGVSFFALGACAAVFGVVFDTPAHRRARAEREIASINRQTQRQIQEAAKRNREAFARWHSESRRRS